MSTESQPKLQTPDQSTTNELHLGALGSLGLSQYESKCFLAALYAGPSTINQIGIVAGVPRTKVYGSIRKLVEKGLLEQSEDNPKIFSAKSPKEVLIPLLEKEGRRIKQDLDALSELETIHQSMKFVRTAAAQPPSKVVRYTPRSSVTRKTSELFQNGKERVLVLTTANGVIRLSRMADLLFERSQIGLKLDIISTTLDEPIFATAVQSLKEISTCTISFIRSIVPIQMILVDSQYILMSELKPDDLRENGMDVGFFIQNTEMADMFEGLIRILGPNQTPNYAEKKGIIYP